MVEVLWLLSIICEECGCAFDVMLQIEISQVPPIRATQDEIPTPRVEDLLEAFNRGV